VANKKPILNPRSTDQADLDFVYWQKSGNQKKLDRINRLIAASCESPSTGIGKPERLRFYQAETYSRRINKQHRLVYRVDGERLIILVARFHYGDK
jgi:toxin YoeB